MPVIQKVRPEIMDSVALLVLDAQDSFINTLHNKEAFLNRCAFAIEAARILRLQTIFTEQSPEKLGRSNSSLYKLAYQPKVFAKHSFSALNAPGIEAFLREKEIYHLLIVGLEVPICVYQTGLQATEEDVDVTFLSDALGSRRAEDEAPVLNTLIRLGCQTLPTETVFYSLLGDAHSPYFAEYNQLVKTFNQPDFDLDSYLSSQPRKQETERRPAPQAQGARKPADAKPHRHPDREPRRDRERPSELERGPSPQREQPLRDRESARVAVPVPDSEDESSEQAELPRATAGSDGSEEERRDERRSRRRGRRRRGRGRDREGSQPESTGQQRPQETRETPSPERNPEPPAREQQPRREETVTAPPPRESVPTAPAAEQQVASVPAEPEKKPARKTARKTAKKAAKKATKKVAKKAARKAAKKAPENAAKPTNESFD